MILVLVCKYAVYFLLFGLMIEYYNIEQMLCFDFEQKKRIDFIIWVQSSAKKRIHLCDQ